MDTEIPTVPVEAGPIEAVDYHTAGEPFRIVVGGVEPPRGRTILDKRDDAKSRLDGVRTLLTHEPRGHADMYGCFVTEPDDDGADLGLVFFHREGFSTACGHGSIAAAMWAYETGRVKPRDGRTIVLDVPSGRVECRIQDEGSHPTVSFTNVPSYAHSLGLPLADAGDAGDGAQMDIGYGGAFYAVVDAKAMGIGLAPSDLPELISRAARIKQDIAARHPLSDPEDARIADLYGVIFFERLATAEGRLEERNVTVFADGQIDRSPCGSGTSARLAVLAARGELGVGGTLVNRSVVDSVFVGRIVADVVVNGRDAVITEVAGRAFRTGSSSFVLNPADDVGYGFLLV